jgi:hypothetical protein
MYSIIETVEENEQDVIAYEVYFNAEESKAFIVERFDNSEAVLIQLANVTPVFPELMATASIVRVEVFGNLTKEAEEALRSLGANIYQYHKGFVRGDK